MAEQDKHFEFKERGATSEPKQCLGLGAWDLRFKVEGSGSGNLA